MSTTATKDTTVTARAPATPGATPTSLRVTPFHPRTSALCRGRDWRRWGGYLSAVSYELTHDREYAAIRSGAGLLDVTPLKKYMIEGPDAERLLDRVVTRNMTGCEVGRVVYTGWCDSKGKLLDDGTVARLGENRFRMTSADANLRWLGKNAVGLEVSIAETTHRTAALALQGPESREILRRVVREAEIEALRFFRITEAKIAGASVEISRTGYTGDLGYEIWIDADDAPAVWDALIEGGEGYGLVPAGLAALDVARIEAGFMLLGVDYISAYHTLVESQTSTPLEMGLGWTVHLKHGGFVGEAALAAEKERGPAWSFVGIEVDWDSLEALYVEAGLRPELPLVPRRTSVPIRSGRRQVGYATSIVWSPLLKKYIALAHVESACGAAGTELAMEVTVEHRPKRALATVVERPFFDPERKRS